MMWSQDRCFRFFLPSEENYESKTIFSLINLRWPVAISTLSGTRLFLQLRDPLIDSPVKMRPSAIVTVLKWCNSIQDGFDNGSTHTAANAQPQPCSKKRKKLKKQQLKGLNEGDITKPTVTWRNQRRVFLLRQESWAQATGGTHPSWNKPWVPLTFPQVLILTRSVFLWTNFWHQRKPLYLDYPAIRS